MHSESVPEVSLVRRGWPQRLPSQTKGCRVTPPTTMSKEMERFEVVKNSSAVRGESWGSWGSPWLICREGRPCQRRRESVQLRMQSLKLLKCLYIPFPTSYYFLPDLFYWWLKIQQSFYSKHVLLLFWGHTWRCSVHIPGSARGTICHMQCQSFEPGIPCVRQVP